MACCWVLTRVEASRPGPSVLRMYRRVSSTRRRREPRTVRTGSL